MKFVHLTPQSSIARVKRNGINTGNGRRGRGVYAVPLMLMQQVTITDDDRILPADPRSSITLWKWLATLRHRHRNLAAVVFRTTNKHWPIELHIELKPEVGTIWLDEIERLNATATDTDIDFVRNAHKEGFIADLKVIVHDAKALGVILNVLQSRGHKTWDRYDESIEVLLPAPVEPKLFEKITPLYRTNEQFKKDSDNLTRI